MAILGAHRLHLLELDQPLEHLERLRPRLVLDVGVEALVQQLVIVARSSSPSRQRRDRLVADCRGSPARCRRSRRAAWPARRRRRGDEQRLLGVDERLRLGLADLERQQAATGDAPGRARAPRRPAPSPCPSCAELRARSCRARCRARRAPTAADRRRGARTPCRAPPAPPVHSAASRCARRAPALRLQVGRVELGRARVRLAHLVVEPERARRVRQPRQPLDLQRRLGLLARQHLEHRHEIGVALGLPQQLGHALARLDVLGIDRERVEVQLGRLALVVEPVVDLARLDEQARPLQPVRRVRHRLDEQLGRLQESRRSCGRSRPAPSSPARASESSSSARTKRVSAALASPSFSAVDLAGLVVQLEALRLDLGELRAPLEHVGRLLPLLRLLVGARRAPPSCRRGWAAASRPRDRRRSPCRARAARARRWRPPGSGSRRRSAAAPAARGGGRRR